MNKKLSKLVAFLLAFAMVFTTLPLMAFAEDEEAYVVSYGSPAILMNEDTAVNLNDIFVEMNQGGTAVSGSAIVWSANMQDGLVFNATAKTVYVEKPGTYKLTAIANGVTKNVWVIAKTASQDKFYLVNIPTFNKSTFIEEDWRIFSTTNNTDVTVAEAISRDIIGFASDYITLSHKYSETDSALKKGSTIVYVDEIFKDFADYTVETLISSGGAATVEGVGGGVGGRITLNEKETGFTTGILSYIRQSKVATITRINNEYGPHGTAVAKDSAGKWYTWQGLNDYHTVKNVYDGNYFSFHYDTETIYEYTSDPGKCTCTNANCIFKHEIPTAGYPAVVGFGAAVRVKSVYVYLNDSKLAPTFERNVTEYTVSYETPAIPMNINTAVDLNNVKVEMDANGTTVSGTNIIWNAAKQDGLYLNKDAATVSVYAAGTYKLTATVGDVTKNVWVVAKTAEQEHFYLANFAEFNRNTFITSDWRIFSSMNNTDITVSDAIDANLLVPSGAYVEVAHKFGEIDDLKKGGTLVYVDEIFNDFGDYTVETSVASAGAATIDGVGAGVGGRVALNEKETGYTTGILSYIRQTKVATITRINNDFGPHGTAISKDSAGKYYTWQGTGDYHTIKTVYDGNKFSFYYDTETIYEYNKTPGTCTCTNANCIFKHTIPTKGYPALVGFGAATRFKSFYVYLNSDEMPDAVAAEEMLPEDMGYDANDLKVPVNTVFDLSNIALDFDGKKVLSSSANIDNVRTAVGEVSNGKFIAYKVGEVTITANYDGKVTAFKIKVVDDDTYTVETTSFADNTISVEPIISDATDSAYYVTVTPESGKELAALGLTINENGKVLNTYETVGDTGNKFRFETLGIENVTISATYIEEDMLSAAPLGATIRLPDTANGIKTGIKFGNRINVVKNDDSKVALKDTANVKIGDTLIQNVSIKEVGTLIIPTVLANGELNVTTPYARKAKASLVTASTAQYSDITAVLVDIPDDRYNLAISARAYVAYTVEGDSTIYYYYGDVIERTYNTVYTAAQPARHYYNASTGKYGDLVIDDGSIQDNTETTIKVELLLEGGTDHYINPSAKSDDISYKIGETVTYAFRVYGNYKLRYMVYKDDAEDNLYGNETIGVDTKSEPKSNKYVKSGVYEGDVFKFSTQMKKAGAIQVKLEVLDSANKVVATFKHTVIVDFDNVGPAVEAPTYYYDENGNQVNSTVAEFYQSSKNEWAPMLEKIQAEVNSTAFQTYWSKKEAGAVYDGTYIYAKREEDTNGYLLYDIQIATEEPSEVLSGATKVSDIFATTANKKFLYNEHTVRPSSFNLTIKAGSAAGSLAIRGAYQGYGDASSAPKSTDNKYMTVNMNTHGLLNNEASSYYTEVHKIRSLEGGTKGFFNEFNSTSDVGVEKSPTELYAYGIIKRDYFGLQFAKMLPEYNPDSKNIAFGGSMGGFRSVLAAAFDSSIKTVNASYTWMGSVGGREYGKIAGGFMPAHTIGIQYFSTVNAAALLGSDVTLNLMACGLGDYTSPPAGLVAAYNAATCNKTIELRQYREHGTTRTTKHYDMYRSAVAK